MLLKWINPKKDPGSPLQARPWRRLDRDTAIWLLAILAVLILVLLAGSLAPAR
jgi:hypothetical protein